MRAAPSTYLLSCPACATTNRIPASRAGQPGKCGQCHAPLPPLYIQPLELTDTSFDPFVSRYPGPVLVEFWAPW